MQPDIKQDLPEGRGLLVLIITIIALVLMVVGLLIIKITGVL